MCGVDHCAHLAGHMKASAKHRNRRSCRQGLIRTKVEAGVGRLVIGNILPCHLGSVLYILHEGSDAIIRIIGGAVNPDGFAVACPDNQLLPPIAEQVCRQTGRTLCGVAGIVTIGGQQSSQGSVRLHLTDGGRRIRIAVQNLTFQISVPIAQEIDRRSAHG